MESWSGSLRVREVKGSEMVGESMKLGMGVASGWWGIGVENLVVVL
jgi:hypothetical protein